jgi:hypothetical protein
MLQIILILLDGSFTEAIILPPVILDRQKFPTLFKVGHFLLLLALVSFLGFCSLKSEKHPCKGGKTFYS